MRYDCVGKSGQVEKVEGMFSQFTNFWDFARLLWDYDRVIGLQQNVLFHVFAFDDRIVVER